MTYPENLELGDVRLSYFRDDGSIQSARLAMDAMRLLDLLLFVLRQEGWNTDILYKQVSMAISEHLDLIYNPKFPTG